MSLKNGFNSALRLLLILLFLPSYSSWATNAVRKPAEELDPEVKLDCTITVSIERLNGETAEKTYLLHSGTKKHCREMAKKYEKNHSPQQVLSKTVEFRWRAN